MAKTFIILSEEELGDNSTSIVLNVLELLYLFIVYVFIHVFMYLYIFICMYINVCICISTYIPISVYT